VVIGLSHRQRIIFELIVTSTVTVTTEKIYSLFSDEVSSASTDTPNLHIVQTRHSAAPWHHERRISAALQLSVA
jgi:hypothetical protein